MLRVLLGLMLALSFPLVGAASAEPTHSQQFLSGRLGGMAGLEGQGCVWLDAVGHWPRRDEGPRYQPLWPEGYSVTFHDSSPVVRLWDPNGQLVAEEGDVVTVAGRVRRVFTICMRGTPYEVERILAVNGRLVPPG